MNISKGIIHITTLSDMYEIGTKNQTRYWYILAENGK